MCVAARLPSNPCPGHSCVLLDLQLGVLGRGDFALCFGVVVSSRRFCRRRFCWNFSSCLADDPTRRNWPACGGGYSPLNEGLTISDDLGHGLGGHLALSLFLGWLSIEVHVVRLRDRDGHASVSGGVLVLGVRQAFPNVTAVAVARAIRHGAAPVGRRRPWVRGGAGLLRRQNAVGWSSCLLR